MSAPAFYHDVLTADPAPTVVRARRHVDPRLLIALAILLVLAALAYAVVRVVACTAQTVAAVDVSMHGFPWAPVLLGALPSIVAFKAGQYFRGWMHARGIRKSHWDAIAGRRH